LQLGTSNVGNLSHFPEPAKIAYISNDSNEKNKYGEVTMINKK
jgi:hypothetical protein